MTPEIHPDIRQAIDYVMDYFSSVPKDEDTDYHVAEHIRFLETVEAPDEDRKQCFLTIAGVGRDEAKRRGNLWL